jgi:hypothetical protein
MTAVFGEIVTRRVAGRASRIRAIRPASYTVDVEDMKRRKAGGIVAVVPAFQTKGIPSRPMNEGSHADTNVT